MKPALLALLIVTMALTFCGHAHAEALVYTWINPTQYAGGAQMAAGDLKGTKLEVGTCTGTTAAPTFGVKLATGGDYTTTGTATTLTTIDLPAGTYCARNAALGGSPNEPATYSDWSNVARRVVGRKPAPPTGLSVKTDLTAWTIVQSRDRVALVAVGTVAVDTACLPDQPVLGMYVVPRAAVTFAGTVQPEVVFGACS